MAHGEPSCLLCRLSLRRHGELQRMHLSSTEHPGGSARDRKSVSRPTIRGICHLHKLSNEEASDVVAAVAKRIASLLRKGCAPNSKETDSEGVHGRDTSEQLRAS